MATPAQSPEVAANRRQRVRVILTLTVVIAVADDGKIFADGLKEDLYVASLRAVPPGKYTAMLVANDGNPEHIAKAEMVIAAKDEQGEWHPKTAPQILERLNAPKPRRSVQ